MNIPFFKKCQPTLLTVIATLVFRVSLATFMLLFFVDYLEPGFVTNWFNPLWLLLLAVVSGMMSQGSEA